MRIPRKMTSIYVRTMLIHDLDLLAPARTRLERKETGTLLGLQEHVCAAATAGCVVVPSAVSHQLVVGAAL